jgi:adenylylsulfate kinase-like enzyme
MSEPSRRANRGSVVWLTGLPSSGKATLAIARIVARLQPAREGDE